MTKTKQARTRKAGHPHSLNTQDYAPTARAQLPPSARKAAFSAVDSMLMFLDDKLADDYEAVTGDVSLLCVLAYLRNVRERMICELGL